MYEENRQPLASGDASTVFARQLDDIKRHAVPLDPGVTASSVLRWADKQNQSRLTSICRRLLLPGSKIQGLDNLEELAGLASEGTSCLLCLNHRCNLDAPNLLTLLEDQGNAAVFDRIVWIAGRKLEEDVGLTSLLVQCVNRVVVAPHSWLDAPHTPEELQEGRRINLAAERAIARLQRQGWIVALFPTGTRARPEIESTTRAIGETYSYLRTFQRVLFGHIEGCTMPVSKDQDFTHETPALDKVIYTFGRVHHTDQWTADAAKRYPDLDLRGACARAIIDDIDALADHDQQIQIEKPPG